MWSFPFLNRKLFVFYFYLATGLNYVLRTILCAFQILTQAVFLTALCGVCHYYHHFTDEATERQSL